MPINLTLENETPGAAGTARGGENRSSDGTMNHLEMIHAEALKDIFRK